MPPKKPLTEVLGENLERWRESKGITQINAAAMLGISQPAYSRIVHGRHNAKLDTIEQLSRVTKLTAAELLTPRVRNTEPS